MAQGTFTGLAGEHLRKELQKAEIKVEFDHRPQEEGAGTIVSSLDATKSREASLSQIDIAVLHGTGAALKALVLLEIEETKISPKGLLGDLLAVLLGDSVWCGEVSASVGNYTSLIVATLDSTADRLRNARLLNAVEALKPTLPNANAKLGSMEFVVLPASDPEQALLERVQGAVDRGLQLL